MKIITQISLFDDTQNENLGDLERLQKVFDNIPDDKLIRKLKEKRGKGRNEWPVEAMWNSFIASFIFDHDSIASLLRELNRNSQRYGFHPKYNDKRIFRIPLKTDPRIFTKLARSSDKWKKLYKKRTSIERINGRIDRDFKFEKHTIRGVKKMKMFLTMTFIIQLTLAKAKIESGITSGLAKHSA